MYFLRYPMMGLPPLTRGVLTVMISVHFYSRITPAYAGNTGFRLEPTQASGDHPRLHGEYLQLCAFSSSSLGSPPLAREVHIRYRNRRANGGITPACAGSTSYHAASICAIKDHPRLRGEY